MHGKGTTGNRYRRVGASVWYWLLTLAGLGVDASALAQATSPSFEVSRQSIDGGARRATSPNFELVGTVGQSDAGPAMTSSSFSLQGGFHRRPVSGATPADSLFANGFESP